MMFVIVGLLYCQWLGAASLAFWLFIFSALTDYFDGLVARRRGIVSHFGIFMDALTDKIFVLGLFIGLNDRKLILPESAFIPLVLLLIILTREFLITGMRLVAATRGVVVSAEKAGKQKTASQLISIGIFLAVPMFEQDLYRFIHLDLTQFIEWLRHIGFWLLLFATFLTLRSAVMYFVKYKQLIFDEEIK